MSRENENQVLRGYISRKKRYIRIRNMVIVALLFAVVFIGLIYTIYRYNRSYHSYKVIKTTDLAGDNSGGYLSYGSSVIRYNKDGAAAYDKSGNVIWKGSYDMSDPIADTCGQYVVIADRGGKSVHIYNNKREVGSYSTDYEISRVSVADQGVVAVLMEEGDKNYITLYDVDGTDLVKFDRDVNVIGYPMDMSLSEDGQKLVLSCLSVAKGDLECNVGFYNFSDVGKNYTNRYVGGYSFKKGILSPRVKFLNNDTVCVYKENGFVIYSMKQMPIDLKEVNFKEKIKSIIYNKSYTGVVLESADGSSKHLMLYNLKGKQVLDKTFNFEYTKILMTDKEIIMYNDLNCMIMKTSGKIKFQHKLDNAISVFYPINNLDRYYLIQEGKLSEIQLGD